MERAAAGEEIAVTRRGKPYVRLVARAVKCRPRARAQPVRGQGRAHLFEPPLRQPISSPPETRTRAPTEGGRDEPGATPQAGEGARARRACRRCRSARTAGRARADPGPRATGRCARERLSKLAGARRRDRGERGCLRQGRDREPPHPRRAHARSAPGDRARPVGSSRARSWVGQATRTRLAGRAAGRRSSTCATPALPPRSWPASCSSGVPTRTRRSRTSTATCRRSTARPASSTIPS